MFRLITKKMNILNEIKGIQCIRSFRKGAVNFRSNENSSKPALFDDGETIFCWHPEPEFPYEHTKPLPRSQEENEMGDSVLKVKHHQSMFDRKSGPSDKQLMEMFQTNIYPWRHVPQKRKIKPNPPKDRDSI